MTETVTYVTQSKFFTPAFNAAIFDGPIRIYFAQYQEAQALKLYFNLQERFTELRKSSRGIFKEKGRNIFVMLYPTDESFEMSFGDDFAANSKLDPQPTGLGAEAGLAFQIAQGRLGSDFIFGVRGPLEDTELESLCMEMDGVVHAPPA